MKNFCTHSSFGWPRLRTDRRTVTVYNYEEHHNLILYDDFTSRIIFFHAVNYYLPPVQLLLVKELTRNNGRSDSSVIQLSLLDWFRHSKISLVN